ncbi:hypothetical protein Athai_12110 [Actinocatenispora thailandica]|uniref:Uncharacterized protein n=1 Tax=Actinocatenispora thailandica TaxID=227318 RepID=A0A7R7HVF5_9ACTN|nr:DUF6228 family protein [Actinocatenispora thailandica]BCJ33708.1 hypothetical protein Athai_12110 [Actinocatenispora thailandica]
MAERFELQQGTARWVLGAPYNPWEEPHFGWRVATELHDGAMNAATDAGIDGWSDDSRGLTVAGFVAELAASWRGWHGVRRWRSLDHELQLDARHDGHGHVDLGVTLRESGADFVGRHWCARTVFVLEAGEETGRLSSDLADALRH